MVRRKKSQPAKVDEPAGTYEGTASQGVSVRVAKDRLSGLLERAARGEEIVITSDGVPKAMLVRYRPRLRCKPFEADLAWLRSMPIVEDSTDDIRAERDSRS